jgi:serine/threonine-protein kinase
LSPFRFARLAAGLLLAALLSSSALASAQTDKAAAEALFREGMRLSKAGSYAEACPKLEESQRLEPSLGVQYYLADCFDKIGRSASAWANFVEVANKARLAGETSKEETARKRADELEPKLARLSVEVEDGKRPGLVVKRGALALGSGQWGIPVPVDPGSYELHASAPGHQDWSKTIEVKPGAALVERVPSLQPLPPQATALAPPAATTPLAPTELAGKPVSSTQGTVGIVVAAVGVVALGTSGVLALMASSANSSSKEPGLCLDNDQCSDAGLDERDRALKLADAATFVSIGGAVLAATGAVIWLTAPKSRRDGLASTQLGLGRSSLLLRGQF